MLSGHPEIVFVCERMNTNIGQETLTANIGMGLG